MSSNVEAGPKSESLVDSIKKVRSPFRRSVYYTDNNAVATDAVERKRLIISRRGCFKWMPALFANDLVHGSWYYVYGSVLAAIIPIFPLINLYQTYDSHLKFWAKPQYVPLAENTSTYALLILIGVLYTIGSIAFVRAVDEPHKPPIFPNFYHFSTDELLGMWLFTLGTFPSIPIMMIYIAFNPSNGSFWLALLLCVIVTIALAGLTLCCYPSEKERKPTKILHHMICACLCKESWYGYHFANDWLIFCWMMVVGCFVATFVTALLLLYYLVEYSPFDIYEYLTGLVDMILFLIGSMYLTAGSYEIANETADRLSKDSRIEMSETNTKTTDEESATSNVQSPLANGTGKV